MKERILRIIEKLTPERRRTLIVALGIVGLLLIFLSSFLPTTEQSEQSRAEPPASTSEVDYRRELEDELREMISSIEGAGDVRVMITMDSTAEDVYAVDKTESETKRSGESESDVQRSEENEYVIIKGKDGSEQTVVKKQKMPEIRGVLVVCTGGASAVTREKVTAAVAVALGISQSRVMVTN